MIERCKTAGRKPGLFGAEAAAFEEANPQRLTPGVPKPTVIAETHSDQTSGSPRGTVNEQEPFTNSFTAFSSLWPLMCDHFDFACHPGDFYNLLGSAGPYQARFCSSTTAAQ